MGSDRHGGRFEKSCREVELAEIRGERDFRFRPSLMQNQGADHNWSAPCFALIMSQFFAIKSGQP
jgi:hypothetical protein